MIGRTGERPAARAASVSVSWAAFHARTAAYRPAWSVKASAGMPSSAARAISSSGWLAPSRKLKFVCAWSSQ